MAAKVGPKKTANDTKAVAKRARGTKSLGGQDLPKPEDLEALALLFDFTELDARTKVALNARIDQFINDTEIAKIFAGKSATPKPPPKSPKRRR